MGPNGALPRCRLRALRRTNDSENGERVILAGIRTLAALIFCAVLLSSTGARATTTTLVTMDGVWWQGLTEDQKIAAVQAMMVAYRAGFDDGSEAAADSAAVLKWKSWNGPKPSPPSGSPPVPRGIDLIDQKAYHEVMQQATRNRPSFDARPFVDAVAEIDSVYRSNPTLLTTEVSAFLVCAATSPKSRAALHLPTCEYLAKQMK